MIDLFRSFATALQDLLPAGDAIIEITVPNRATRLLIVDYGDIRPGHSFRTMTNTTRRADDFSTMSLDEIYYLGKCHSQDKPSFQSMTFECFENNGIWLAEPVCLAHHAANCYELAISHDSDGYRHNANPVLQRQLALHAAREFKGFRAMGFFGPKALKRQRPDLPLDRTVIDITLECEYFFAREMEAVYRQSYQTQMDFLLQCEQDRQQQS